MGGSRRTAEFCSCRHGGLAVDELAVRRHRGRVREGLPSAVSVFEFARVAPEDLGGLALLIDDVFDGSARRGHGSVAIARHRFWNIGVPDRGGSAIDSRIRVQVVEHVGDPGPGSPGGIPFHGFSVSRLCGNASDCRGRCRSPISESWCEGFELFGTLKRLAGPGCWRSPVSTFQWRCVPAFLEAQLTFSSFTDIVKRLGGKRGVGGFLSELFGKPHARSRINSLDRFALRR